MPGCGVAGMRWCSPGVRTEGVAGAGGGGGLGEAAEAAWWLRAQTCLFLSLSGPCWFSRRSRSSRRAWPRGRCSGPPIALHLPLPAPVLSLWLSFMNSPWGTVLSQKGSRGWWWLESTFLLEHCTWTSQRDSDSQEGTGDTVGAGVRLGCHQEAEGTCFFPHRVRMAPLVTKGTMVRLDKR